MKNTVTIIGDTAFVKLTQEKTAIIDAIDVPMISHIRWCAEHDRHRWYVKGYFNGKTVSMHRLLLNTPTGTVSDHVNGDGLDNRRVNLRLANNSQNKANSKIQKNRKYGARHKGIWWRSNRKRWVAQVRCNGRVKFIGMYKTQQSAAAAYAREASALFGEFARNDSTL